ncbi:MAG: hypothetical protein IKL88_04640 [Erysipelotrichales bacterium]|nr:hypothetical protein [Erysipelotrichales bacterium]
MRKFLLILLTILLCSCTSLQQGPGNFDLSEEFIETEDGTVLTISSLELEYISKVTDCLSYEIFNDLIETNKKWKEAKKEQRLVTLNDVYTASVVRYSLKDTDMYYVFKIRELEDTSVMYEVDVSDTTDLSELFENDTEIISMTLNTEEYVEVNGYYITPATQGRNYDEKAHDLVVGMYTEYAEEGMIEEMPFGYASITTMFYSEPQSHVDPFYVQVDTGNSDKVYRIERNADTYTEILYDQPIPENNKCIYLADNENGNFLCRRYEDKLYYTSMHLLDSLETNDLLEETKVYGDILFDEYADPEQWKDTTKEYRVITVNGEYAASIARYSAMHSYGKASKYFFIKIKVEDGKYVMYEYSTTNQNDVTDTVVSFFENEDEIIEIALDEEKYDVIHGYYVTKKLEAEGYLAKAHNIIVEQYQQSATPFKYVDIEPLYYYTDGTLTHIYVLADYGTHTTTYHFPLNTTSYTSATLDEKLPTNDTCIALDHPGNIRYSLCREGNTLYRTTK